MGPSFNSNFKMRVSTALVLCSMAVSTSAFGVVSPMSTRQSLISMNALPPMEDMPAEMLEEKKFSDRWGEIKVLSPDEAESTLKGDELEAFKNYHQHITDDLARMSEIAGMIVENLDKTKLIKPKSKSQRKRDKWELSQKRAAANAAAEQQK